MGASVTDLKHSLIYQFINGIYTTCLISIQGTRDQNMKRRMLRAQTNKGCFGGQFGSVGSYGSVKWRGERLDGNFF